MQIFHFHIPPGQLVVPIISIFKYIVSILKSINNVRESSLGILKRIDDVAKCTSHIEMETFFVYGNIHLVY